MTGPLDVLIVGGGMITHDQILPSIYHLQRLGAIGSITICALNRRPLKKLAEAADLIEAFPGQSFESMPDFCEGNLDQKFPELYKEAISSMQPDNLVIVAVPDPLHYEIIMEALNQNQNVLAVKPLVQRYEQAVEIDRLSKSKGLHVGVEYHKRFDRRALLARRDYRNGKFGEFKIGEARLIEAWDYRVSNFQNWFTKENSDPFTYVGCHYVDQVYFMTGLRPVQVSVRGIEGQFPNGNTGYLWSLGVVTFENGGILSVINGLGYPDDGAGPNDQGITLFCEGGEKGALIRHNDQLRGVMHSYVSASGPGGTFYNFINPDYFRLVPWECEGLKPVGYGYDSIEANIAAVIRLKDIGTPEETLQTRQEIMEDVDRRGLIATPANSSINELVTEAARISIAADGKPVDIQYDPKPRVVV